ncbi:MAG: hypothetical protein JO148_04325 [Acidimicrobiia bacterium]|nr:hypothetical protein [Acidimicrobiia bacterium]
MSPRIELDPQLAERLIEGRAGDELPAAAGQVARVLDAARSAATESDDSAMEPTVAAMRAVLVPGAGQAAPPVPVSRRFLSPLPRVVAAGVAGLTVLFGGLAAAGALPAAAQKPVADFVSHVGIDLPRPASEDKTSEKPAVTTTTTTAPTPTTVPTAQTTPTTAPTTETTVAPPTCPAPSYAGPNGCVTPLPVPVTPTTAPPPTTTTTAPPLPTTTTSTTIANGASADSHGPAAGG